MHLTTVHSSSYYSGPTTTNITSTVHCLNMSMTSRIMRGCRTCISLNGTNATAFHGNPASTIHSRNVDYRESQGMHTTTIIGIIAAVLLGLLAVAAIIGWAVKSNKAAFEASGGQRGRVVRHGNSGHGYSEKGATRPTKQAYQGSAGLNAPPRSHGGRAKTTQFPGPRNGYAPRSGSNKSARSNRSNGPYCDGSPYSATPTMEARGDSGRGQNHYSGRPAPSQSPRK